MEFLNEWEGNTLSKENAKKFLQILAPFAPFITEEIWSQVFGEKDSIHVSVWPAVDTNKILAEEIQIPVQVNGKVRAVIQLASSELSEDEVVKQALNTEQVNKYVVGKKYKAIYVRGKIVNIVIQ